MKNKNSAGILWYRYLIISYRRSPPASLLAGDRHRPTLTLSLALLVEESIGKDKYIHTGRREGEIRSNSSSEQKERKNPKVRSQ